MLVGAGVSTVVSFTIDASWICSGMVSSFTWLIVFTIVNHTWLPILMLCLSNCMYFSQFSHKCLSYNMYNLLFSMAIPTKPWYFKSHKKLFWLHILWLALSKNCKQNTVTHDADKDDKAKLITIINNTSYYFITYCMTWAENIEHAIWLIMLTNPACPTSS